MSRDASTWSPDELCRVDTMVGNSDAVSVMVASVEGDVAVVLDEGSVCAGSVLALGSVEALGSVVCPEVDWVLPLLSGAALDESC